MNDNKKQSIHGKKISKKKAMKALGDPKTWAEFSEKLYKEFRKKWLEQ